MKSIYNLSFINSSLSIPNFRFKALFFFVILNLFFFTTSAQTPTLYGMTPNGGSENGGIIFSMPTGSNNFSSSFSFTSIAINGSHPNNDLVEASNGRLYGMTQSGGTSGDGVLFEYTSATGTYTELFNFDDSNYQTGRDPYGSLIQASNGKLYGMTYEGGAYDNGVLFEYDLGTNTYSVLLNFDYYTTGAYPYGSLMQASNGKLYGMAYEGGANDNGVLFEYDLGTNTYSVLLDFDYYTTGAYPVGSLVQASNGKLYGIVSSGGLNGDGVLFEYDFSVNSYSKLFDFDYYSTGASPLGSLTQASNGKLYGMTNYGDSNDGTIFEYDIIATTYSVLLNFASDTATGAYPYGSLTQASNGKLYGMVSDGGSNSNGVLFELDPVTNIYTKKINFAANVNGSHPYGSLIQTSGGKLFGMTHYGGASASGILFEYNFTTNIITTDIAFGKDGSTFFNGNYPYGSLLQANNGKFYGLTNSGGTYDAGVLFEYDPLTNSSISKWNFDYDTDGGSPYGSLMQATNGKLYGLTSEGGLNDDGTLFEYDILSNILTVNQDFDYYTSGAYPYGSLLQANNGLLYGMTSEGGTNYDGTLFEYDILSNALSVKHDFDYNSTGSYPYGSLMQAGNGLLYGMTSEGGVNNDGTLFEYNLATNSLAVKHFFDYSSEGGYPSGSLIQLGNGKIYGMTGWGAANDGGSLFEYNPATTNVSVKKVFDQYANPYGSLLNTGGGKLYGMTNSDGLYSNGTIFEYNLSNDVFTVKLDFDGANGSNYSADGDGSLIQVNTPTAGCNMWLSFDNTGACMGNPVGSITVTPTDGVAPYTYSWSPVAGSGSVISGLSPDIYTVTVTDANSCSATGTIELISPPTFTIGLSGGAKGAYKQICFGDSTVLAEIYSDDVVVSSYTWIPSNITNANIFNAFVSPTVMTIYTVTGSDAYGCLSLNTATVQVDIDALPVVVASASSTVPLCPGTPISLMASGADTYVWSPGNIYGDVVTVPAAGVYTVTGTDSNDCSNTATIAISVLPSPTVIVAPTVTVVPSGSVSVWIGNGHAYGDNGPWTLNFIDPLPVGAQVIGATLTYDAHDQQWGGTDQPAIFKINNTYIGGYTNSITATYASYSFDYAGTVSDYVYGGNNTFNLYAPTFGGWEDYIYNTELTLYYGVAAATVCAGQQTALSASVSGAVSYSWSGGIIDNVPFTPTTMPTHSISVYNEPNNLIVQAISGTIYTLTAVGANGCVTEVQQLVFVNGPIVNVNSGFACAGNTFVIQPSGANSYSISGGNFTVSPFSTTTYSVTGTDTLGCSAMAVSTVSVNANPVATLTSSSPSLCIGQTATLSVVNTATDYALHFDGIGYNAIPVSDLGDFTIEYWMRTMNTGPTGTQWYSGNGIVDADDGGINPDFGTSLLDDKLAFGIGGGDVTIISTSPVNTGNWLHVAVSWSESTGDMSLYVNGVLEASLAGPVGHRYMSNIAIGNIRTGGRNYIGDLDDIRIWNTVRTGPQIVADMSSVITGTEGGLLLSYDMNEGFGPLILHDPSPNNITANLSGTIEWFTKDVNEYMSFVWNPGNTNTISAVITPSAASIYSVVVSNAHNCSTTYTSDLVIDYPITVNSGTICSGGVFTITPSGGITYTYSSGSNVVTPSISSVYTVTGTSAVGCVNSIFAYVNVFPLPDFSIASSNNNVACLGLNSTLSVNAPPASYALNFDGADDYVGIPYSPTLNPSAFTAEAWIKANSSNDGNWHTVISSIDYDNDTGYGLYINPSGQLDAYTGNNNNVAIGGTINTSVWTHVAMTYDGSDVIIYINGVETASATTTIIPNTVIDMLIGAESSDFGSDIYNFMDGQIDEVRLWNYAMTSTQIQAEPYRCLTGSESGLVAYYAMTNGPSSSVLNDNSGNGYAGTLNNMNTGTDWVAGIQTCSLSSYLWNTGATSPSIAVSPTVNTSYSLTAISAAGCAATNSIALNVINIQTANIISTYAGSSATGAYGGDNASATTASLNEPTGLAVDASGNLYIADYSNHRVRKVSPNGIITTAAGTGSAGYSGDGSSATSAELYHPTAVAVDATGNIYIADAGNQCIRKINNGGIISTFAGDGTFGFSGDGGLATSAQLYNPTGVAIDASGNVYIADQFNHCIRKVDNGGFISTFAGTTTPGYSGDNGPATSAQLNQPYSVATDVGGNVYITDNQNNRVRKVDNLGNITTVAGDGTVGYGTNNVPATSTSLYGPQGVAIDNNGNIYFSEFGATRIRKVNTNGIITVIAGNGTYGFSGDGGVAASAQLDHPYGVAIDAFGNLYIADTDNNRIRTLNNVNIEASPASLCSGNTSTLSVSAATSYTWSTGNVNTPSITVQPTVTTTYSLITGGCATTSLSINVSPSPTLSIFGNSVVCLGSSITQSVSGADTYSWNTGQTSNFITISPSVSTIYNVVGTNTTSGCSDSTSLPVMVNPAAIFNITNNSQQLCSGQNATLSVNTVPTGYGLDFDGVDDYISIPYSAAINPSVFTIETWVKVNAIVLDFQSIVTSRYWSLANPGTFYGYALYITPDGKWSVLFGNGFGPNWQGDITGGTVQTGVWTHIAMTHDGTNMTLYVNGAIISSTAVPFASNITQEMRIGAGGTEYPSPAVFFGGQMDEFRIWNYAMTGSQIQNEMGRCLSGTESGLISYYTMTNGSGNSLTDNSGNGHTGTLQNMNTATAWVAGIQTCNFSSYNWNPGGFNSASISITPTISTIYTLTATGGSGCVSTRTTITSVTPIQSANIINTYAGTSTSGFNSDGIAAISAQLYYPFGITTDASGNLYIADHSNQRIRKVDAGTGIINTIAGIGSGWYSGDGGPATSAELNNPFDVAVDASGNVYVADADNHRIRKIDAGTGIINTIAGTGTAGFSGDGSAASSAQLSSPQGVAIDAAGNIYIAEAGNHRIRKIDASTGIINTVAGIGSSAYSGDGGQATSAELNSPFDVALDVSGNIYIADLGNNCIRKITMPGGIISTIAGTPTAGYSGDNGQATLAKLNNPTSVALDPSGNVYIVDNSNHRIRKINAYTGIISTIAGSGANGFSGDNGQATSAHLSNPYGVAIDAIGKVYISDRNNHRIRSFYPLEIVATSTALCSGNNVTLTANSPAQYYTWNTGETSFDIISQPTVTTTYSVVSGCASSSVNITIAPSPTLSITGNSITCSGASVIYSISGADTYSWSTGSTGSTITLTPSVSVTYSVVGTTTAAACSASETISITVSPTPTISITGYQVICEGSSASLTANGADTYSWSSGDLTNNVVLAPSVNTNYTITGTNTLASCAQTKTFAVTINSVQTANIINTFAGDGTSGYGGDGSAANLAQLSVPFGAATDAAGNVYVAEYGNSRIRKINPNGIINTIAGTGVPGFSGDGGLATSAQLDHPTGVVVDAFDNVYITDQYNGSIRKVDANGMISTIFSGLASPIQSALDAAGNIYVADSGNDRVIKITPSVSMSVLAGGNGAGYSGDGGLATSAQLSLPKDVAVDAAGNVYIADANNQRIRKVNTSGIISTIAGNTGTGGYNGDNIAATSAQLNSPTGVAVDASGNIYITDANNQRIRKVNISGIITTIAGTGTSGYSGDGGAATAAQINGVADIVVNDLGKIYFTEQSNSRIRTLYNVDIATTPSAVCLGNTATLTASGPATTYLWNTAQTFSSVAVQPTVVSTYSVLAGCATASISVMVNPTPTAPVSSTSNSLCAGQSATLSLNTLANSYALDFDGVDDYVSVPYNAALNTNNFTVEFWTKVSAITGSNQAVMASSETSGSGYFVYVTNTGVWQLSLGYGGGWTDVFGPTVQVNQWTHIAATYDGAYMTLYVNGEAAGTPMFIVYTQNSSEPMRIGSGEQNSLPAFYFDGQIDEVRLWNTALNATQIQAEMGKCLAGNESNLVAYYAMNNGTGSSTLSDNTTNGNNGTLQNMNTTTAWVSGIQTCNLNAFSWSSGGSASSINVSPASTTSYVVTYTNTAGCSGTSSKNMVVNSQPTVVVSGTTQICATSGGTGLTASGADTYSWSNGSISSLAAVNPTVNSTYTVVGTNTTTGCQNTAAKSLTVNPRPVISVNSGSICSGKIFTITPSGANTYSVNNVATINFTYNPASTTNYSVSGTSSLGCVSNAAGLGIAQVTVNTTPTVSVNSGSICTGNSFTIIPSGANVYAISGGTDIVSPAPGITAYSVTGTSTAGCVSNNTVVASVTVNIRPTISVNSGSICSGYVFTMTPSGAFTYTYSSGTNTVNPLADAAYSVTGTSSLGCISSSAAVANVSVYATPTLNVNSGAICFGSNFVITPNGASTYTITGNNFTVSPGSQTNYSVTGTSLVGCAASNTAISTVTVNSLPVLNIAGSNTVCFASAVSQTVSGTDTYSWSSGQSTDIVSLTPSVNTTYSVTGTNSLTGCKSTSTQAITVYTLPIISVNSGSICSNNVFTIIPSGASTYTYSSGTNTVAPLTSTNYAVTGTDALGCVSASAAVANVTVHTTPTVNLNGGAICYGQTFTLVPTGANTYTLLSGISAVSPTANTSYSVTGSSSVGCISYNTAVAEVTVNSLPVLAIAGSNTVCFSLAVSQTVSGTDTYSWSSGQSTDIVSLTPSVNTTYSVTGTNTLTGCKSTSMQAITVYTLPIISVNNGSICSNNVFTITPSGASTYTYSSGTNTVAPLTSTNYAVTGTDALGCVSASAAVANVTVHTTPTVNLNGGAICYGQTFTLVPTGANTYTLSSGISAVSPTANASYSVTGSSSVGCISYNTAVAEVTVNSLPVLAVAGTNTLCFNLSVTQTVSGADTYSWSSSQTTSVVSLSPSINTTYSVTGTNTLTGCQNQTTKAITVYTLPIVSASSGSICSGKIFTINPSGALTYVYSSGANTVSPLSNTSYSVTGTDVLGCVSASAAVVNVTVVSLPVVSVNSGTVCNGNVFTMVPSGAATYTYSNGSSTVIALSNNSYSVTGTSSVGCVSSNTAVSNVTVIALPVLSLSGNSTVCFADSLNQSVSGADNYLWVNTGKTVSTVTLIPSSSTTYSVIGTSSLTGCSNQITKLITVYSLPTISIIGNTVACTGSPLILTGSGADTYTWSPGNFTGTTVSYSPATTATYIATGTSTDGCVSANTPSLVAPIYPSPQITITPTGSVNLFIGSGQTPSSSWNPWVFTFTDPLPVGSYITGIDMTYTGVDQGWGGSGMPTSMYVADSYVGGNVLSHSPASLSFNFTGSIPNYVYGGNNTFKLYFAGWPGWQSFISNANLLIRYGTSSKTVCAGQLITLSAAESSGTIALNWSGGQTNNVPFFAPNSSQVYTVSGTNAYGCTTSLTESLIVKPIPTLAVNSGSICTGQSYTINASGANTYTWNTSSNNSSIIVNPMVNASYTVSGTNSLNCSSSVVSGVTVNITPAVSIAGSNTVCYTSYVLKTASGADTYTWSTGANTKTISVNPLSYTTYSVTGTTSLGCVSSNTAVSGVSVYPTPTISVNSGTACQGTTFTMIPSGALTYTYSNGSPIVMVNASNSYSVTGTNSLGCVALSPAVSSVTMTAAPALSVIGSSLVCEGASISQTVSGASNYTWSTGSTNAVITVAPPITTTYNVSGVNPITGCLGSMSKQVIVGSIPVISVNSGNVCSGSIFTLMPSGAATYTFSSGSNTVSPLVNTSYYVTGKSAEGCVSTSSAVANVIISPLPVVAVNNGTICSGKVFTIVPSGANTYTFSSVSNTVNPISNTTYSVWGTDILGCVSMMPGISTVSVNASPIIAASSGSVCMGSPYTIVPNGAGTYTYSGGTNIVSPTSDTSYSITGSSTEGCAASNTAVVTVSVMTLPVISVNSGSICEGSVFTMTATGANTYTYSTYFNTSTVIPISSTSYSVTGTSSAGCVASNTAVASVTLMPVPTISVSGGLICANEVFTITPSGASTYTYSSGSNTVSPNVTSNYTVTGSSAAGCAASNTAVAVVLVKPTPQLAVMGNSVLCVGNTTTLTVSGSANTYTWISGNTSVTATGSVAVVTPSLTDTYTVTGIASNGCFNSAIQTVSVNSLPIITVLGDTLCPNEPFVLQPNGAVTYTYSGGSATVIPTSGTVTYSVTGTDANGCISLPSTATLVISNNVSVSVSGNTLVCSGSPASLTASGGTSYLWSTGQFTSDIAPTPTTNSTYTVVGSVGFCVDTAMISVNVKDLPTPTVSSTPTVICTEQSATLVVSGAASYSYTWSENNQQTDSIFVSPSVTTNYTITALDTTGCENTAVITMSVSDCLDIAENKNSDFTWNVYPNPNTGEFFIETDREVSVSIMNVLGQLIKQEKLPSGKNPVNLNTEAKGIYFVEIKYHNKVKTVKVVKQG